MTTNWQNECNELMLIFWREGLKYIANENEFISHFPFIEFDR